MTKKTQDNLPEVIVSGNQFRERVDAALEALKQAESAQPTIFVQDTQLVRVIHKDKVSERAPISLAGMRNALTHSADYYRLESVMNFIVN